MPMQQLNILIYLTMEVRRTHRTFQTQHHPGQQRVATASPVVYIISNSRPLTMPHQFQTPVLYRFPLILIIVHLTQQKFRSPTQIGTQRIPPQSPSHPHQNLPRFKAVLLPACCTLTIKAKEFFQAMYVQVKQVRQLSIFSMEVILAT